ncbi:MAG: hypothetical protein LBH43_14960 [Treponema sp.]|nr:hypothetical protein [Treponema sp.]
MNINKLLDKFTNNWPAKAISIALAIVLFIFHRVSTLEERFFMAPLNIEADENLTPSKWYPQMIRINLKGNSNTIFSILDNDIEAYIDLGKYRVPGDYRAEIQLRKKGTALGIETLQIRADPVDIELSLDYRSRVGRLVPPENAAATDGENDSRYRN